MYDFYSKQENWQNRYKFIKHDVTVFKCFSKNGLRENIFLCLYSCV